MTQAVTNEDVTEEAEILALGALGWVLADTARAARLLALTGLDAETLRGGLGDRAMLAAVLAFLEAHEPDLVACAAAMEVRPSRIAEARGALER